MFGQNPIRFSYLDLPWKIGMGMNLPGGYADGCNYDQTTNPSVDGNFKPLTEGFFCFLSPVDQTG
jgi:hypothetical protein